MQIRHGDKIAGQCEGVKFRSLQKQAHTLDTLISVTPPLMSAPVRDGRRPRVKGFKGSWDLVHERDIDKRINAASAAMRVLLQSIQLLIQQLQYTLPLSYGNELWGAT